MDIHTVGLAYNMYVCMHVCYLCMCKLVPFFFKKTSTSSDTKAIEDLKNQLSTKSKQCDKLQEDIVWHKQKIGQLKEQTKVLQDKLSEVRNIV